MLRVCVSGVRAMSGLRVTRPLLNCSRLAGVGLFRSFSTDSEPRERCIVTLVGQNRRGIVHDFSQAVLDGGANLENSTMSRLGGRFAMLVELSTDAKSLLTLEANLKEKLPGYRISVNTPDEGVLEQPEEAIGETEPWCMTLEGPDQPGIVRRVSQLLWKHGAAIVDMDTETFSAPMAGYTMFRLFIEADMPVGMVQAVGEGLDEISEEMGLEIEQGSVHDE
mmetsp:Transcript_23000/g.53750  ORF Transcript_23000/g.53750 Transcript_23000/m.53750 type:complete len:222 (+) Transcript_23000:34-699(+)|eukprot:CAMPEP_0114548360 /NCGR_PEP_ID=MMETSP0114-20121206/4939_1 /TAXON_ID=31324 /ORGANISM="Goniomonas sp, Strain m" /LENGTH=221 /DNA_ID=CAMNT_0001732943 /DNA_START=17 /DNA_END=682 /DNA_ORIENTATION=+